MVARPAEGCVTRRACRTPTDRWAGSCRGGSDGSVAGAPILSIVLIPTRTRRDPAIGRVGVARTTEKRVRLRPGARTEF